MLLRPPSGSDALSRTHSRLHRRYFFQQDLLTCIHSFFKHAEGTFGVSASCTLWPSSIVLAAKGQPVSLAFDMERPIAVWSSEPSSLMVRWPAAQAGRPRRSRWTRVSGATGGGEARPWAASSHGWHARYARVWGEVHFPAGVRGVASYA